MVVYVLITTSLIEANWQLRQQQYIRGITSIMTRCCNYKIVIVENNGQRQTFLDNFGVDVFYTNTNVASLFWNKGYKEMTDIHKFMQAYNVGDDDFIIKVTGRYFLHDPCPFFHMVDQDKYDCIIRYGASGLIGMRAKYMKLVEPPNNNIVSVETHYDNVAKTIDNKCVLEYLGIYYINLDSDFARYH